MRFSTKLTLAVLVLFNLCAGVIGSILLQQNFNAMLDAACGQYARMQLSLCRNAETALDALPKPHTAAERNNALRETVETTAAYFGWQYARVYIRQADGTAVYKSLPAGITDMEVSSFMKKFKDKKFAAKCDREVIRKGCEMLGMEVKEVASLCIEAMKEHAEELCLGPKA